MKEGIVLVVTALHACLESVSLLLLFIFTVIHDYRMKIMVPRLTYASSGLLFNSFMVVRFVVALI